MVYCYKCGKQSPTGEQYCGKCGVVLLNSGSALPGGSMWGIGANTTKAKCKCNNCKLWCDSACKTCHPPKTNPKLVKLED